MSDSAAIDSITLTRVDNGTPGEKGADGKTQYFHTKYSDDGGKTFTGNAGEDPGDWLGKYTDFTEADSTDVASYTWAKIKGDQGEQGEQGEQGKQGEKGDTGAKGDKGTDGVSPTVTTSKSGTTTTISIKDATGTKTATINDGAKGADGSMLYATCSTAAATAAKVATLSSGSLTLAEGRTVTVTFTNGNTASSPTLNVAGTGAKAMKCQGSTTVSISAGASVSFTYHSSAWYVSSEPVYGSSATIGNSQSKNVYINGDGVNIRSGTNTLASFTPNTISLGNNSKETTISMMGGATQLIAKKVNDSITLNDLVSTPAIRISDKASGMSGASLAPAITVGGEDVVIQGYNGGGYPVMINGAYYYKKASTTVSCSYGLSVTFTRIGQMVEAVCNAKTTAAIPVNSTKITLCTIPYHYRPAGAAYTVKSYQAALGFIEVGVESTSITLGWYRTENGSTAGMSTYPSGNWLRFHEVWLTYDS